MNDEVDQKDDVLNPKHRGLGRGLNALFEDEEDGMLSQNPADAGEGSSAGKSRTMLSVDQLFPNVHQPRRLFKDETLGELADSIQEHGVLQPLMVRSLPGQEGQYQIIAGERRWRAAQMAKLHEVPVIMTDYDDQKTAEIALIENLQREDLNSIDEAAGFQYMIDEYGYTQELLAKKMGKSRSYISNTLRLLALPDRVAAHLSVGDITMGHARALLTAPNAGKLCDEVVGQALSVRETEKMVARVKAKAAGKEAPALDLDAALKKSKKAADAYYGRPESAKSAKDEDTIALEQELSLSLGMNVSIDGSGADGQAGNLKISYKSLDQLDELLEKLTHGGGGAASLRLDG